MLNYPYRGCSDGSINLWLVDYLDRVEPPTSGEAGEGVEEERWGVKFSAVATLKGHQAALTALQFTHHTSSLLASGCRDGSVSIWDVQVKEDLKERLALVVCVCPLLSAAVSRDEEGLTVVSGGGPQLDLDGQWSGCLPQ